MVSCYLNLERLENIFILIPGDCFIFDHNDFYQVSTRVWNMATIILFNWKNIWWNNQVYSFYLKRIHWSDAVIQRCMTVRFVGSFLIGIWRQRKRTDEKPSSHQLMQTFESQSINQAVQPCLLHMGHHSGRRYPHHYHEFYFISHI